MSKPGNIFVNEAGLVVTSSVNDTFLWTQAVDCFTCNFVKEGPVYAPNSSFILSSITKWNLELRNATNKTLCRANDTQFGEEGVYTWNFNGSCNRIDEYSQPIDSFHPIFFCEGLFLLILSLKWLFKYKCRSQSALSPAITEQNVGSTSEVAELIARSPSPLTKQDRADRVRSLDVFRGLTIILMIFVNYGGGEYSFLQHSPWNGVTVADMIFPWFAWIMGVSVTIKMKQELRNRIDRSTLMYNICVRSAKLIVIGLILSNMWNDDLQKFRIPGVLQRLGLTYLFVALLEATFMKPQLQNSKLKLIEDLMESWKQWIIVIGCVVVHTGVTFFLPVPNCPTGYLGPGGLSDHSNYSHCTGGAAGYIDRLILTSDHIYSRPTCLKLYKCDVPYDPEGLLGTLTCILCVYLGVQAGRILLVYESAKERLLRMLLWSLITIVTGLWLCNFSINGGLIPLNKNLWSLSYVLVCSGLAFLVFSILYYVIDKKKWSINHFVHQTGANAILLYIGHSLTKQTFPWQWKPFYKSSHYEYLFMDLWGTFLWILIAVILYRRQIFIVL